MGTEHCSTYTLSDDIFAFPDPKASSAWITTRDMDLHGDDGRAGGDVLDESGVERSRGEVDVVLLGQSGGWGQGLDTILWSATSLTPKRQLIPTRRACSPSPRIERRSIKPTSANGVVVLFEIWPHLSDELSGDTIWLDLWDL